MVYLVTVVNDAGCLGWAHYVTYWGTRAPHTKNKTSTASVSKVQVNWFSCFFLAFRSVFAFGLRTWILQTSWPWQQPWQASLMTEIIRSASRKSHSNLCCKCAAIRWPHQTWRHRPLHCTFQQTTLSSCQTDHQLPHWCTIPEKQTKK